MTMHPTKRNNKDAKVEALGERGELCESLRCARMQFTISHRFKALLLALGAFLRPS